MLAFVKSNTPSGSSICFDYAALSDSALNENGAREMRNLLNSQYSNEPTRFGIRAGEIESFLGRQGFEITQHLTAAQMTERYLPANVLGNIPSLFCLVHAQAK